MGVQSCEINHFAKPIEVCKQPSAPYAELCEFEKINKKTPRMLAHAGVINNAIYSFTTDSLTANK
jgi:hypothetical protein